MLKSINLSFTTLLFTAFQYYLINFVQKMSVLNFHFSIPLTISKMKAYFNLMFRYRLGQEKYKSKVSNKPFNPQWFEQFDFHLYDDQSQELEITVWKSKLMMIDDFIGR